MAIYWPTPGFKGKAFKLCVLTRCDFNFCARSSQLRGAKSAKDLCWCLKLKNANLPSFFFFFFFFKSENKRHVTPSWGIWALDQCCRVTFHFLLSRVILWGWQDVRIRFSHPSARSARTVLWFFFSVTKLNEHAMTATLVWPTNFAVFEELLLSQFEPVTEKLIRELIIESPTKRASCWIRSLFSS